MFRHDNLTMSMFVWLVVEVYRIKAMKLIVMNYYSSQKERQYNYYVDNNF
jgi:hypothetical protein